MPDDPDSGSDDVRAEPPPARMSDGRSDMRGGATETVVEFEGDERFQPLRRELGVSAFGLNLIRLRPRQQGRIHRHDRQEEVYVVVAGTLTLELEGEPRELPTGAAIRVAPAVRRRLSNRGDAPLAVLAVGGAEPHEGRDGVAFASWEDRTGASPQQIPLPPDLELP